MLLREVTPLTPPISTLNFHRASSVLITLHDQGTMHDPSNQGDIADVTGQSDLDVL